MKSVLFWAVLALTLTTAFAQSGKAESTKNKMVVHKLDFSVDNLDELEGMDWDDVFVVFKDNQPMDSVQVGVTLKDYTATNSDGVTLTVPRMQIFVRGLSKDRERLKEQLKNKVDRTAAKFRKFRN